MFPKSNKFLRNQCLRCCLFEPAWNWGKSCLQIICAWRISVESSCVQDAVYLFVLFLTEHGESRLDTLVQKELQSRLPKLVDPLCVQAGVNSEHQVRLLHFLSRDVPASQTECHHYYTCIFAFCVPFTASVKSVFCVLFHAMLGCDFAGISMIMFELSRVCRRNQNGVSMHKKYIQQIRLLQTPPPASMHFYNSSYR